MTPRSCRWKKKGAARVSTYSIRVFADIGQNSRRGNREHFPEIAQSPRLRADWAPSGDAPRRSFIKNFWALVSKLAITGTGLEVKVLVYPNGLKDKYSSSLISKYRILTVVLGGRVTLSSSPSLITELCWFLSGQFLNYKREFAEGLVLTYLTKTKRKM